MAIEIKKLPNSEVEISIEVPAEDFNKYYQEVFEEISKSILVDGFRPGKAPKEIVEKKINHDDILHRTAERAIQKTYFPLLEERKIEAIGRPEMVITKIAKGDSFCFKAKTAVLPEITLSDYKKIAQEIREKSVPTIESEKNEVKKESINENVEEKALKEKQKKQLEIIEAISAGSRMEIPGILISSEKEKMLGELRASIENMGMKWQDYLGQIKKEENDLRKEWHEDAIKRIKYNLILREVAVKEGIDVSREEVESDVNKILEKVPGLDPDYLRIYTYGIIRNEKVFKFLETC